LHAPGRASITHDGSGQGRIILRMLSPALLAIGLVLFVLLLVPTSRLQRAGWSPRALGGYLVGMFALSLLVTELPGPTRLLVPIIVLGYLAPFIAVRLGRGRWRRPSRPVVVERPPIKTVHGPARDVTPTSPDEPAHTRPDPRDDGSAPGR
jgi:hypothetical protein